MLHIKLMSMKRQQHGSKYFARRLPTPPPDPQPWRWVNSEVNLVVKLVKCTNSYEGQRAGDLRLEHVFTAQPADRKWRVLHKIPRFT